MPVPSWKFIAIIASVIIVILSIMFAFSGPAAKGPVRSNGRVPQRGGEAQGASLADDPNLKQYEEIINQAEELMKNGPQGTSGAIQLFQSAIELVPKHPLAHFNLARVSIFTSFFIYEACDSHPSSCRKRRATKPPHLPATRPCLVSSTPR